MSTVSAAVDELRSNHTNGGSWMARRATEALLEVAAQPAASSEKLVERLRVAARELAMARPSMGAITHAVGRLVASAQTAAHLPPEELQRLVTEEANGLIASRERAAASIAVHLAPRLTDALVLTHSNSATVREAVTHTPPARVYCTVSAPFNEGLSLAEDLRSEGLDVDIVDGDELIRALGSTSFVLVGADTVYEDGSLKNKIGTRPLAEAARNAHVRTIVACELLKLAPIPAPAVEDEPDLRDTTPPELLDEVVTEEGPVVPEQVRSVIERTPFLQDGYRLLQS